MASPYGPSERPEVHDLIPASAKRVMDVGANDGSFAAWLKQDVRNRNITCVEPNPAQAQHARLHCDQVVTEFYPRALETIDGEFDCVTFNHVLEHMPDPWDALSQTRGRLSPTGCVVATIPNIRYLPVVAKLLLRGRWDYETSGHLDRTHLRFFTRSSVMQLFGEAQYVIDTLRPTNCIANVRAPLFSRIVGWLLGDLAYGAFVVRAYPAGAR